MRKYIRTAFFGGSLFLFCCIAANTAFATDPLSPLLLDQKLALLEAEIQQKQANMDHIWTMIAACLVFLMQGGFLLLEAGMVRAKNSINVAQKNIADFILATLCFSLFGFSLMFGSTHQGWIGLDTSLIGLQQADEWVFTFFVFQLVFCGTAATIVSGAVAERMRFRGYLIITLLIALFIYPIYGHWAWGNLLSADNQTFLAALGFIDFAGSTVVHSIGGWVALAAVLVIGPRVGKYNKDGSSNHIPGHNPVLAALGVLLLWVGWIGFNGGSTTAGTPAFAHIIANTMIAAAIGGLTGMLIGWLMDGYFRPDRTINGIIAGLVGITAGCDVLTIGGSALIGLSVSLIATFAIDILDKRCHVDDAVGAISVHGIAGAAGTLLLVPFAPSGAFGDISALSQFSIQALGVGLAFVWGFGLPYLLLRFVTFCIPDILRVSADHEQQGLNYSEHKSNLGSSHLVRQMQGLFAKERGDLPLAADESEEIAHYFQRLITRNQSLVKAVQSSVLTLSQAIHHLKSLSGNLTSQATQTQSRAHELDETTQEVASHMSQVSKDVADTSDLAERIAGEAEKMSAQVSHVSHEIQDVMQNIDKIASSTGQTDDLLKSAVSQVQIGKSRMTELREAATETEAMLTLITRIASQTNLLALNATIEAARTGTEGQGFAVVAQEVKKLADETCQAVAAIEHTIQQMQSGADNAVDSMNDIAQLVATVTTQTDQINEALQHQSQLTKQVTTDLQHMSEQTDGVSEEISHIASNNLLCSQVVAHAAQQTSLLDESIQDVKASASLNQQQSRDLNHQSDQITTLTTHLQVLVQDLSLNIPEKP